MTDTQISTIDKAVHILYSTPYDNPYRARRIKYADQMELVALGFGDPQTEELVLELAEGIVNASEGG